MDNVTPVAIPVINLFIQNASKFGPNTRNLLKAQLLAPCAERNSMILTNFSLETKKDGSKDFPLIKALLVKVVGRKTSKASFTNV